MKNKKKESSILKNLKFVVLFNFREFISFLLIKISIYLKVIKEFTWNGDEL